MQIDKQKLQTETIKQLEKAIAAGKITRQKASDPAFIKQVVDSAIKQIHTKAMLRPNASGGTSPIPIHTTPADGYEYLTWDSQSETVVEHSGPKETTPAPERSIFGFTGFNLDYRSPGTEVKGIDLFREGWEQVGQAGAKIYFRRPLDLTQQEAAQQKAARQADETARQKSGFDALLTAPAAEVDTSDLLARWAAQKAANGPNWLKHREYDPSKRHTY